MIGEPYATTSEPPAPLDDPARPSIRGGLRRAMLYTGVVYAFSLILGLLLRAAVPPHWFLSFPQGVAIELFLRQDLIVLLGASLVFACALALPLSDRSATRFLTRFAEHPRGTTVAACLVFGLTAAVGVELIYDRYALSLDEFLARFQASALLGGSLIAPIPREWFPYARALQPIFMRYDEVNSLWVPGYQPGNAGLIAMFEMLGAGAWTHVVTGAAAVLLVAHLARRAWPDRIWAAPLAALLLATSAQVWITAMTSYAMTPHLTLSLLWVALFLRDDRAGHVGAALVGFLAVGLHHVYVHVLVAAPFLWWLISDRRWTLAFRYVGWYAGVLLFWLLWRDVLPHVGALAGAGFHSEGMFFLRRIVRLLTNHSPAELILWPVNLARFFAWQNLALLPLLLVAGFSIRTAPRLVRAGVVATALLLLAHALLMPWQGHGWGYRYLHPAIGFIVLLAIHGAVELTRYAAEPQRRRLALVTIGLGLATFVVLPLRAAQVHRFVHPYARASQVIESEGSEVVVIDDASIWFGVDLVRNDPFLRHSPKVLAASLLSPDQFAGLCNGYETAFLGFDELAHTGLEPMPSSEFDSIRHRRFVTFRC